MTKYAPYSCARSRHTCSGNAVVFGCMAELRSRIRREYGPSRVFRYCSACHGPDGSGNGPVARSMRPRPSNLRHLAVRNGGEFPAEHVRAAIDGRTAVAAQWRIKDAGLGARYSAMRRAGNRPSDTLHRKFS